MKEKLWAFCRKLISLALNLSILYMETIAMPISWDYGHELVFTMYTELSNMFNVAVCALVALCQLLDLFTGRELPRWVKQLKFWSTSCLTMTFLTVVFILAPMYGRQRLVHHAVYGLHALPPLPQPGGGHGVVPAV